MARDQSLYIPFSVMNIHKSQLQVGLATEDKLVTHGKVLPGSPYQVIHPLYSYLMLCSIYVCISRNICGVQRDIHSDPDSIVVPITIICKHVYLYIYINLYAIHIYTSDTNHSHPPPAVLLCIAATLVPERHAPVRVRQQWRTSHAAAGEVVNHDDLCSPVRKW